MLTSNSVSDTRLAISGELPSSGVWPNRTTYSSAVYKEVKSGSNSSYLADRHGGQIVDLTMGVVEGDDAE